MGEHGAFGGAGGSAGILEQRQSMLGIEFDRGRLRRAEHGFPRADVRLARLRGEFAAPEQAEAKPLQRRQHPRKPSDHQPFEDRAAQHLDRGGQQLGEIDGDHQPGARIGNLRLKLGDGVERREIDDRGPGQHRPVIGRNVDRHIGQKQSHPVTRLDPPRLQARRELARLGVKLGIAPPPAEKIHQRTSGMLARGSGEHGRQRERGEILLPDAGMRVAVTPRWRCITDTHVSELAPSAREGQEAI